MRINILCESNSIKHMVFIVKVRRLGAIEDYLIFIVTEQNFVLACRVCKKFSGKI